MKSANIKTAFILHSKWAESRGDCIDACAAPGNKTSHLAALISDSGPAGSSKIYAFDKSRNRSDLLRSRMDLFGATAIVSVENKDFLAVDTGDEKYSKVTCVLLDPSCSGSGVFRALERVVEEDAAEVDVSSKNRIDSLRQFQISAIKKAMSFPSVESVSYSTCSVHVDENESVVAEIISSELGNTWQLEAPKCMASWRRRGLLCPDLLPSWETDKLIRCDPSDGCNGFFVALFKKKRIIEKEEMTGTAAATGVPSRTSVFSDSRLLRNFVWTSGQLWTPWGSGRALSQR